MNADKDTEMYDAALALLSLSNFISNQGDANEAQSQANQTQADQKQVDQKKVDQKKADLELGELAKNEVSKHVSREAKPEAKPKAEASSASVSDTQEHGKITWIRFVQLVSQACGGLRFAELGPFASSLRARMPMNRWSSADVLNALAPWRANQTIQIQHNQTS